MLEAPHFLFSHLSHRREMVRKSFTAAEVAAAVLENLEEENIYVLFHAYIPLLLSI